MVAGLEHAQGAELRLQVAVLHLDQGNGIGQRSPNFGRLLPLGAGLQQRQMLGTLRLAETLGGGAARVGRRSAEPGDLGDIANRASDGGVGVERRERTGLKVQRLPLRIGEGPACLDHECLTRAIGAGVCRKDERDALPVGRV
ncbi:MAG: hypothetical protein BWX86_02943 [Verrucomicrobia bacterium ADurb.Bin122]|nr:MAG: hypothetical protein BWX86_02943 [Verrucomicrobia bacterium ADurb.Bin122]